MAGAAAMVLARSGAANLVLPILAIAGGGAVFLLRRAARTRAEKLRRLLDRLVRHVAATARPELPRGTGE